MSRPTRLIIQPSALLHNLNRVKQLAAGKQVIAMVKANAYGCGLNEVIPVLDGQVDAFGVACLEEALTIRKLGGQTEIILFQGVLHPDELQQVATHRFSCVIHQAQQLQWLLERPLEQPIKVWVKVNTGMNRLGFFPSELDAVFEALNACGWVDPAMGLMTHFASADEIDNPQNAQQIEQFHQIQRKDVQLRSAANSAVIFNYPALHGDAVRPGIMLYGVSPFADQNGSELGLKPVMHFVSAITAIHHYPPHSRVGYGGCWQSDKPSIIAIVPVGYGDGYPRHIAENTPVWLNQQKAPIVGRVSMDMLAIDISHIPETKMGDAVEMWGTHIPVEEVARSAGTIPYELICQVSERVRAYG